MYMTLCNNKIKLSKMTKEKKHCFHLLHRVMYLHMQLFL